MIFNLLLVHIAVASKLIQSHIFIVHGISQSYETPIEQIEADTLDGLTPEGQYQIFKLGQYLAEQYMQPTLKGYPDQNKYLIESLDHDSSLQSAHLLSYSLFLKNKILKYCKPPQRRIRKNHFYETNQTVPEGYWPQPYHAKVLQQDDWSIHSCPVYRNIIRQNQADEKFISFSHNQMNLVKHINQTYTRVNTIEELDYASAYLYQHGNLTAADKQKISIFESAYKQLKYFNYQKHVWLIATQTMRQMLDLINDRNQTKLYIKVGKSSNILMILSLFEFTSFKCTQGLAEKNCIKELPHYGSQAIFEIWELNGQEYVKFKYNGKYFEGWNKTLDEFISILKNRINPQYDEFCNNKAYQNLQKMQQMGITNIQPETLESVTVALIIFALICFILTLVYRRRWQVLRQQTTKQQIENQFELQL